MTDKQIWGWIVGSAIGLAVIAFLRSKGSGGGYSGATGSLDVVEDRVGGRRRRRKYEKRKADLCAYCATHCDKPGCVGVCGC